MSGWWQRQTLRKRLAAHLALVIAAGALLLTVLSQGIYDIAVKDQENAIFSARVNEAKTLADMSDNIGVWASHYGGMWSQVARANLLDASTGSHVDQNCYASKSLDGRKDDVCYVLKNPALIQREVSDVTERSESRAKFRMTSDKFVNPNNAPNRFESAALESIRDSGKQEYYEVKGEELLYARRIVATNGCLQCHGVPEDAPALMRARYPLSKGYGYEVGKVVGVTSVRIPLDAVQKPPRIGLADALKRLGWPAWAGLGLLALAIANVFFDFSRNVVRSLRILTDSTVRARDAEVGQVVELPVFVKNEHQSANEIHRLSHAIKAFHEAFAITQRRKR